MTEIYKLNNKAAILIQREKLYQSIQLLQKPVCMAQDMIFARTQGQSGATETTCREQQSYPTGEDPYRLFLCPSPPNRVDSVFLAASPTRASTDTSRLPKEEDASPTRQFTMFRAPVLFDPTMQCLDKKSLKLVSYALVYNLALAYHLMAVSSTCREEVLYCQHQALLYKKSHTLLSWVSLNQCNISTLHPLALACNVGHLYDIMGEREKSDAAYRSLLTIMCFFFSRRSKCTRRRCRLNQHAAARRSFGNIECIGRLSWQCHAISSRYQYSGGGSMNRAIKPS